MKMKKSNVVQETHKLYELRKNVIDMK